MEEDDAVVRLPRPGASVTNDPLLEVLRSGARRMLQQVIETEVEGFLSAHGDLEDMHGRRPAVRNGHAPEREIQTGIGPIAVRRPKLRDRGDGAGGEPIRFTSKGLPPFLRRTRNVEELLPWLCLKGVSTGQFEEALTALLGPDAPGPSASTVRRLVATWQAGEVVGEGIEGSSLAVLVDDLLEVRDQHLSIVFMGDLAMSHHGEQVAATLRQELDHDPSSERIWDKPIVAAFGRWEKAALGLGRVRTLRRKAWRRHDFGGAAE